MVWFQCEDCGENLKKPKLPNHFRICSAYKLSCIDCGVMFDKQSVQSHTQCITEAEKYGPKGQGNAANGTPAKPNKDKPKPDVDINVGLSDRPPWLCSLCNTKATSKQTLLLHADGKKHRAKARAYTANQQAKSSEESIPNSKDPTANALKDELPNDKKENGPSNEALEQENSSFENGNGKKRKIDASKDDDSSRKLANGTGNGYVNDIKLSDTPKKGKKAKHEAGEKGEDKKAICEAGKDDTETSDGKEGCGQKGIKWKKLITLALKSAPDEGLKMKKLRKRVQKSLQESGITVDGDEFKTTLEHKVISSSKFTVDGKFVRLTVH